MNDTQLKHLSVLTALNQMMSGSSFNICTLRDAMQTLGTQGDGAALRILTPLHCIKWHDMPPELREAVPRLIERCLEIPAYQFQITPVSPAEQARVQTATIRLLTR